MKHFVFAAFGALAAMPAAAQSPLSASTITVQRYDEIVAATGDSGISCCAPLVLESGAGADFHHVRVVFDVAYSDTLDRVSVSSNDIALMLPGATEGLRAVGHYDYIGVFEDGAPSIYETRPRDWPAVREQAFLDGVWIVPEGVTSAMLMIGPEEERVQVPVDFNVAPVAPVSPAQTVAVEVTGFTAESALSVTNRVSRQELSGRVVPVAGQALRLDIQVTPRMSTATDAQAGENRFFLYAENFALVGPDGLPLPYMGYQTNNGIRQRYSVSFSWDAQPRPDVMELYYLGLPVSGTYTVYYLQDPVAQFTLQ